MNLLSRWFGAKYPDQQLVSLVQKAIEADPLINDPSVYSVTSKDGIVSLAGIVHNVKEKDRVESVVRTTLKNAGIKFQGLNNGLKVT